ncbi:P62 protein [Ligustrum leprosis virus]|uniref:P62 protein n=1 Tax=Ligustrum leprosis virus TaxID=2921792 RepID=UPI002483EDFF|nr:P62 protein [Ligustrum leprosis virus]UNH55564.1 P62 protein [Ligustrum leprosis virus]
MSFSTLPLFLNATLNILTLSYVYVGPFNLDPACITLGGCTPLAGCKNTAAFERVVERNIFTKDDKYCIRIAGAEQSIINISHVQTGVYELFGKNPGDCDNYFASFGVFLEDRLLEPYLELCRDLKGQQRGSRYDSCELMPPSELLSIPSLDGIIYNIHDFPSVNITDDFVGFTLFRQNCPCVLTSFNGIQRFDGTNKKEYKFPVCENNRIPFSYDERLREDEFTCPMGFYVTYYNLPFTHFQWCVPQDNFKHYSGMLFPSRASHDYDHLRKSFTISASKDDLISRDLRYQRKGFPGRLLTELRVVGNNEGSFATSKFCINLVYDHGHASFIQYVSDHIRCNPDGCTYSGLDYGVLQRSCRTKIRVSEREFLSSSFVTSFEDRGKFLGNIVYSVDYAKLTYLVLSVYKDERFYTFYPKDHSLKLITVKLVKPESEWYMKAMNFFAEEVIKKILKTLFTLLGSAIREIFGFIVDVGGCCFQHIIFCFLDMIIVLVVLLPCYNHLPFLLLFCFNLYTKLVVRENCCFSAADRFFMEL